MIEESQEIELRDYINVIIKRKWIILTIFFTSVVIVTMISFSQPKIYMATATIQNGNVKGPIIKKAETEEIIKSQDLLSSVIKNTKIDIGNITSLRKAIEVEHIKETDFFRLIVKYKGADVPVKVCQGIIDSYFAFTKPIYQERMKFLDSQLKELDNQLKDVENDMQSLQRVVHSFSLPQESQESNEAILEARFRIISALSTYRNLLLSLTSERDKVNLVRINTKEFKVIDAPLRQKSPIKPKKCQHIIISGIVGLMFGIFLAFFVEYWEKFK